MTAPPWKTSDIPKVNIRPTQCVLKLITFKGLDCDTKPACQRREERSTKNWQTRTSGTLDRSAGNAAVDAPFTDAANGDFDILDTDTQLVDCVGTYSDNSDPEPFPDGPEAGLNVGIDTKSQNVRGITDLAGDYEENPVAIADLPIGCFPLRAAE
ncbi:MAG: hypothetical protein WD875_10705 [Pirellulales bacterium]